MKNERLRLAEPLVFSCRKSAHQLIDLQAVVAGELDELAGGAVCAALDLVRQHVQLILRHTQLRERRGHPDGLEERAQRRNALERRLFGMEEIHLHPP